MTQREKAIALRKAGKTFFEINKELGSTISKSTLSYWCKGIVLSASQKKRIEKKVIDNMLQAQKKSVIAHTNTRNKYLKEVHDRVAYLADSMSDVHVAKISLAMLYLGEGSKTQRGSMVFGNSDPRIIKLFLKLLRKCYTIDEKKFRCTVQCRADQDIRRLERFWREVTKIPAGQFYATRIDPRTAGKRTKKPNYKGVCRIDYFNADVYTEILKIIEVVTK